MQAEHKVSSPHSRAIIEKTLELNSLQAQKVINRSFDKLRQSLFSLSVILRITYEEDEIEAIDTVIDGHFEKVEADLLEETGRIMKILNDNGIDTLVSYSRPERFLIEVDSPKAMRFLLLTESLDQLMAHIDSAWLGGQITDAQKKQASHVWQQRLIKLAGKVIGVEGQARSAATKRGLQEKIDAEAPEQTDVSDDKELQEAVESTTKDAA